MQEDLKTGGGVANIQLIQLGRIYADIITFKFLKAGKMIFGSSLPTFQKNLMAAACLDPTSLNLGQKIIFIGKKQGLLLRTKRSTLGNGISKPVKRIQDITWIKIYGKIMAFQLNGMKKN